jgi:Protein of unknown function (DUF1566)
MKIQNIQLLFLLFIVLSAHIYSQGTSINTSGAAADASAILDVSSTTQGMLVPRMTQTQRLAIAAPASGLLVYQTDSLKGLYYFNGTVWGIFSSGKHYIGESYGGGIVFYIDTTGQHGLIKATTDQSTGIRWFAGSNKNTMAFANGVGAGRANTVMIIDNQNLGDGATYAARICNEYTGGNFGDWYLPSIYELNLMYQNITTAGGFTSTYYWSSSESGSSSAYVLNFGGGSQLTFGKDGVDYVRAIRQF